MSRTILELFGAFFLGVFHPPALLNHRLPQRNFTPCIQDKLNEMHILPMVLALSEALGGYNFLPSIHEVSKKQRGPVSKSHHWVAPLARIGEQHRSLCYKIITLQDI